MFARPSYRFSVLLLATFTFITSMALLESWLKAVTNQRYSIISAPIHEPDPPPKRIKAFWAEWAAAFERSRPPTEPITVQVSASTAGSDEADGDREPSQNSLDLSQEAVELLQKAQKPLLDRLRRFDARSANGVFAGTGVVMVAGGQFFAPAITSIRMLRRTGSKLPVHVFLQAHWEYEAEVCEEHLPLLGAKCFVLEDFLRDHASFAISRFQLKALAILFSPFSTVLYLDSDCMPVRNPAELLSAEPFASTGLIAWPDYWIATEDPVFYTIAGLPSFPAHVPARSTEAGQLLIDKEKHLASLLLAAYYNIFGPHHFYPLLSQGASGEGDKETFIAAALVLGKPYYRVRARVGTVGYFDEAGEFKGCAMVQHHPGDEYLAHHAPSGSGGKAPTIRPFFLHANMPKMNLGHLVDEPGITTWGGEHRRLWGPQESQEEQFGIDLERAVWREMLTGECVLEGVLRDWEGRGQVCERGREHWEALFGKEKGV